MKQSKFVICIENKDFPVSLEIRKIYEVVPDSEAEKVEHIRVIDESGEDYLYPSSCFIDANLPKEVQEAIETAA